MSRFHEDLQAFRHADALDVVRKLLGRHADQLGFEWFVYALRLQEGSTEPRLALVDGYPEPWIEHYFREKLLAQDPVIAYSRDHLTPIDWAHLGDGAARSRVMTEAADFGLRAGASAPLHARGGELGVLSLATQRFGPSAARQTKRALPYAQLLAAYVHESLRRVSQVESSRVIRPLTPRERECLLWVIEGKTSWEIGEILHLTERTVNFHLVNVNAKLGVTSRQHAVAKALLLGLLHDGPGAPVRSDRSAARRKSLASGP